MLEPVGQGIDLYLAGGEVADVRAGRLRRADVAIAGDRIASLDAPGRRPGGAARILDVSGRVIVPGYIEPHTHFSLASPSEFAGALLRRGTTTAVVDALPVMMLARPDRLPDLLERMAALPMKIRHLIRLHPQSFSGESRFALEALRPLWRLPSAAAVGEVTRWVDVLRGDRELLEKIAAARADGRRVEGHAPGASSARLVALAEAGITSCHEAITAGEVEDRLRAGLAVMLRHSSIRPDLPELLRAVKDRPEWLDRVMLTADGSTPAFVEEHGYLDYLMRLAIEEGIEPLRVLRMVTLTPAAYFGFADAGEVAAGRRADLNVLAGLAQPTPLLTIADGRVVAEGGRLVAPLPPIPISDALEEAAIPRVPVAALAVDRGQLPGLRLVNDVITEPVAPGEDAGAAGALRVALIDQHGRWITRGLLYGFVDRLGGVATTICSSFGDVIVAGQRPEDMAAAVDRLADAGGGLVAVEQGEELFRLPLEDRLYTRRPWEEVVAATRAFAALMRARGYRFRDPLFTLLFLAFDSLPWIRLTSRGVWDVRAGRVLSPAAPLEQGKRPGASEFTPRHPAHPDP